MEIGFDDRSLAHLQIIVGVKLRRHEQFFVSWVDSGDVGSGRSSLWVSPSVPMMFAFSSSRPVRINQDWLKALAATADRPTGIDFVPEPGTVDDRRMRPHSHV
jgi:hypothetical protein